MNLIEDKKQNDYPLPVEMKEFAAKYSHSEWSKLASNNEFLRHFTESLPKAQRIAKKIIGK